MTANCNQDQTLDLHLTFAGLNLADACFTSRHAQCEQIKKRIDYLSKSRFLRKPRCACSTLGFMGRRKQKIRYKVGQKSKNVVPQLPV